MAALHVYKRLMFLMVGVLTLAAAGVAAFALHGAKLGPTHPKAVVDQTPYDLGVIESGEEFQHTFIIRNEGQSPLTLAPGPKLCACTLTHLP
jgi:hypothetical protein